MSEDIVVRLKGYDGLVQMSPMTTTEVVGACQEAASAIEALRAENARLRADNELDRRERDTALADVERLRQALRVLPFKGGPHW